MHAIWEIFFNHVLIAALIGWFVAQGLKIPIHYLVEHEWDLSRFHGSGGMPSSHTAMVVSAAIMIGATNGYASGVFAVAVVVALIVMYDATGVRRETGHPQRPDRPGGWRRAGGPGGGRNLYLGFGRSGLIVEGVVCHGSFYGRGCRQA